MSKNKAPSKAKVATGPRGPRKPATAITKPNSKTRTRAHMKDTHQGPQSQKTKHKAASAGDVASRGKARATGNALRFKDIPVLVTGGAEGIGRGIALAFATEGAAVFIADVKEPSKQERKQEVGLAGTIQYYQCDVGIPEQVENACKAAGPRYILINNVATQPEAPCHKHSLEDWMRALNVNLTSYFLFSKYCIPHMLHRAEGVIVNVASVQGLQSQPGIPGYAASKGGVLSLTRQLAMEYADQGIRVNAVNPGTIDTPLVSRILKLRGTSKEEAGAVYPMKRIGQIKEVTSAVLFLASSESSFMTGESINVDGGIMGLGGWAQVA